MSVFLKKFLLIASLSLIFSFAGTTTTQAQAAPPNLGDQIKRQVNVGTDAAGLGKQDSRVVIAGVIKIILSIVGMTFTILMVYSGYSLLTAAGDESKVEKAKKTVTAAVIGLALTLGAYSLTSFLGKSAVQITNERPQAPENDKLHWQDLRDDLNEGLFEDTGPNVN